MTFVSPVVPEVDCRQDDETPAQIEVKRGTDVSPRRMIPNGPAGFFFTSLSVKHCVKWLGENFHSC